MKKTALSFACWITSVFALFGQGPEGQLLLGQSDAHDSLETNVHIGWESRYFSEGRDSLSGVSLLSGSFEMALERLAFGIWYGNSPDQSYDELQMGVAWSESIGDFEFYGSYTHLRFISDGAHDNEIGAGVTWSGLPHEIALSADVYYSFEAEGYFAEISASREFALSEQLTLNISTPFGINQGYVSDGHNGANFIALRLDLEYAISDSCFLSAHATQSWTIDQNATLPGDDSLIDFFHLGLGVGWKF